MQGKTMELRKKRNSKEEIKTDSLLTSEKVEKKPFYQQKEDAFTKANELRNLMQAR